MKDLLKKVIGFFKFYIRSRGQRGYDFAKEQLAKGTPRSELESYVNTAKTFGGTFDEFDRGILVALNEEPRP